MAKILIIEDDSEARESVARIIETLGHIAIKLDNGILGYEVLSQNPTFDLVIAGANSPGMTAKDLILQARKVDELKSTPIMMMSGMMGFADINDLLEMGASYFFPKPVDEHRLLGYLDKILNT